MKHAHDPRRDTVLQPGYALLTVGDVTISLPSRRGQAAYVPVAFARHWIASGKPPIVYLTSLKVGRRELRQSKYGKWYTANLPETGAQRRLPGYLVSRDGQTSARPTAADAIAAAAVGGQLLVSGRVAWDSLHAFVLERSRSLSQAEIDAYMMARTATQHELDSRTTQKGKR